MPKDGKYGRVVTDFGNLGEDEPVFIVRAKDQLSVPLLKVFKVLAEEAGTSERFLNGLLEAQDEFETWQALNTEEVKLPD